MIDSGSEVVVEKVNENVSSNENHYNREELRQRYGDVLDVLEELLSITKTSLRDSKANFEKFQKIPEEKLDFELIRNTAHKVKGTALSLSFGNLASIAMKLEKNPSSNPQNAQKLIQQLIDEISYLDENIQEL